MQTAQNDPALRRVIRIVVLLNGAYFGVEFVVARLIGSVSLLADSIDFLEDAAVNSLILLALRWSVRQRARIGMVLAGILLVPGLATLWTAWQKINEPVAPAVLPLFWAGAGALVVNLTCAFLLTRFRHHSGSLTKAAFLSARNDAFANIAILVMALVTVWYPSPWPDLVVGLGIALMNADAAKEVWQAARQEHRNAEP